MGPQENTLKKVEAFASQAHHLQTRKYSPEPFILHPIRVTKICTQFTSELSVLAAALLHDVLEDTDCSKEALFRFLSSIMSADDAAMTLYLVDELTDVFTKNAFPRLNRRRRKLLELQRLEKTSAEAQTIKYADVIDNCSEIVDKDPEFAAVFLAECRQLLQKLNKGKKELRLRAFSLVENSIKKLKDSKHKENSTAELV